MFKKVPPSKEWIVYDDNNIMRQKSQDLSFPLSTEDNDIISKMISYIDASYNNQSKKYNIRPGIGIAAIQFGYPKKIIYIHFDEQEQEHKYLLANPKIISQSFNKSFLTSSEGCLSVKKKWDGYSIRRAHIIVEAFDLFENKTIKIKAKNLLSICLQHEIDHLNGSLFYDRINKNNPLHKEEDWIEIKEH
ncbi:MAG: peptide deformylase [Malacoplasma sp.]